MPVEPSNFTPSRLLGNGHVQTVLAGLLPRRVGVAFERERLELPDGDFLDLDRVNAGTDRTVVISHGLEGSSGDACVLGTAALFHERGWNVIAWNYRGCSGEPNRLPRAYHSGDTEDLAAVIARAGTPVVVLVGFSLGGNLTLKYLGGAAVHPSVCGAVAVSAPVDLASSARAIDRHWANRVYLNRLLGRLMRKIRCKARQFPDRAEFSNLTGVCGFHVFDDRFTAPLHGFASGAEYWARCSAKPVLLDIRVPTLLVNALDDPFLTPECFPFEEARQNGSFFLEAPRHGGHLGFLDSLDRPFTWIERRIVEFLESGSAPIRGRQTSPA